MSACSDGGTLSLWQTDASDTERARGGAQHTAAGCEGARASTAQTDCAAAAGGEGEGEGEGVFALALDATGRAERAACAARCPGLVTGVQRAAAAAAQAAALTEADFDQFWDAMQRGVLDPRGSMHATFRLDHPRVTARAGRAARTLVLGDGWGVRPARRSASAERRPVLDDMPKPRSPLHDALSAAERLEVPRATVPRSAHGDCNGTIGRVDAWVLPQPDVAERERAFARAEWRPHDGVSPGAAARGAIGWRLDEPLTTHPSGGTASARWRAAGAEGTGPLSNGGDAVDGAGWRGDANGDSSAHGEAQGEGEEDGDAEFPYADAAFPYEDAAADRGAGADATFDFS